MRNITRLRANAMPLKECFDKEISYWKAVITEPIEISALDKIYILEPVDKWSVGETLFNRKYSCLEHPGCVQCCLAFHGFFQKSLLPQGVIEKIELLNHSSIIAKIKDIKIEYLIAGGATEPEFMCPLNDQETGSCPIHKFNPISCTFPLVNFRYMKRGEVSGVTFCQKTFGRNWLVQCPVEFEQCKTFEEFDAHVLWRFRKFEIYMNAIGISHRASELVEFIADEAQKFYTAKPKKKQMRNEKERKDKLDERYEGGLW